MHGAAFAFARTSDGPEQFIEQLLRRQPLSQGVPMAAEGRSNPIVRLEGKVDANRCGFLPLALVDGPGHGAFQKQEFDALLEFADEHHSLKKGEEERPFVCARCSRKTASRSLSLLLARLQVLADN